MRNGMFAAASTKVIRIAFFMRGCSFRESTPTKQQEALLDNRFCAVRHLLISSVNVMRSRVLRGILTAAAVLMATRGDSAATGGIQVRAVPPQPPAISADTRLLVIAPHPDDEVLGAGGLMQRVNEAGGQVRVVYLTNGDAYRAGVRLEQRAVRISARDFRSYGRRRQKEARAALATLGLDP